MKRKIDFCLLFAALFLSQACALHQNKISWNDVPTQKYDHQREILSKNITNNSRTSEQKSLQPKKDNTKKPQGFTVSNDLFGGAVQDEKIIADIGLHIDRALMHFQSERVRYRHLKANKKDKDFELNNWKKLLTELNKACAGEPEANDFGAFVRARAVIDVEQHKDLSRNIIFSDQIQNSIDQLFIQMDSRVAELRLASPEIPISPSAGIKMGDLSFTAPLSTMIVTSPFGMRIDPIHRRKRFHAGVDIGAPLGSSVLSSEEGIVIYAGWQGGYGRHVVIEHGNGIRTHYSHLSAIFVKSRQHVKKGDSIASVGASGRATGPHLHWAVTNSKGKFVDPIKALHERRMVQYKRKKLHKSTKQSKKRSQKQPAEKKRLHLAMR